MPKKCMAVSVPRPKKCSKCGKTKFSYWGKHSEGLGDSAIRGYLWKCETCQNVEFVERPTPPERKKK